MVTLGTLFSGLGAPEFAAQEVFPSSKFVFACDNNRYAKETFLHNHKVQTFYDDVLTLKELPLVDVLVFGFPCQPFSVAGKRQGLNDIRGQLIFHVIELIKRSLPLFFIAENVKGLKQKETFETILAALEGTGYHIKYVTRNGVDCGIPQHRDRVWIVGSLGTPVDLSFTPVPPVTLQDVLFSCSQTERVWATEKFLAKEKVRSRFAKPSNAYMPCLTRASIARNGSSDEYIDTVATVYHAINEARKPTVEECRRLFGFPEHFSFPEGISNTQRYNMFANSMVVPVVASLLRGLSL